MQAYDMNKVTFSYENEEEAFPKIDPGVRPFGSRVLVQIRRAKRKTAGGIILAGETRDTEMWNTQVATDGVVRQENVSSATSSISFE